MGDAFAWRTITSACGTASNWTDTTTGTDPATVAPGANGSVTVNARPENRGCHHRNRGFRVADLDRLGGVGGSFRVNDFASETNDHRCGSKSAVGSGDPHPRKCAEGPGRSPARGARIGFGGSGGVCTRGAPPMIVWATRSRSVAPCVRNESPNALLKCSMKYQEQL
jgi:hypothetical protein